MYEPESKEEMIALLEDWEDGKRLSGNSFNDYIKRRRTIHVAWNITVCLRDIAFEDILSNMYFKCSDEVKPILHFYEDLLIDSKLRNQEFRRELHRKCLTFADKIKAEKSGRLLAEFYNLISQAGLKKNYGNPVVKRVFSAYQSLVQQSMSYCYDDLTQFCYAVTDDGTFLTVPDKYPMLDWAQEGFAEAAYKSIVKQKPFDEEKAFKEMQQRFAKYGHQVNGADDIRDLCGHANNYGNILCAMMYYMSEQTKDMIPQHDVGLSGYALPKQWLKTEYYKERLLKRNFALPGCVKATCRYAGDVREVYFREVIKDDAVVMLYRVVVKMEHPDEWSDYSGYYIPSEQLFYFYYDIAEGGEAEREPMENFVLELYFLLTVRRTEEEKTLKQYTLPLIAEEYEDVDKVPRWPKQPIISFSIDTPSEGKKTGKRRKYQQGVYEYDNASIGCFVRRLPVGQTASWEAQQNAEKYGYELEKGYTFVTPFERKQRHIKLLSQG